MGWLARTVLARLHSCKGLQIAAGYLPGFPPHLAVAIVFQELLVVSDPEIKTVDFIEQNDPKRRNIESRIEYVEELDIDDPTVDMTIEEQAAMLEFFWKSQRTT